MRRWLILAAIVAQLGVLAYMAAQREWVVRTGESVLVRTAPIDPEDPMRGEYARLRYEISSVPKALCRDGVATWFSEGLVYSRDVRDRRVFALLERDETGVASLVGLTDREPTDGIFLRGRAQWLNGSSIEVRYGIEALFMEQGRALEFENQARYEKAGVPVNAEFAVGSGGLGVLRAYHWEPLGITIRVIRRDPAESDVAGDPVGRPRRSGVIGAVVTLKNHSAEPVAIVDLPRHGSFRLVPAEVRSDGSYVPAGRPAMPPEPTSRDIVLLEPGESREVRIDLTAPEWFVVKVAVDGDRGPNVPIALESLDQVWGAWFRIEYAPPSRASCAGLVHADKIRHARLRSSMFNPSGGID